MVWVFPKSGGTPFRSKPSDIAVEKHLYSPGIGPEPKDDSLEIFLGDHVEGPAVEIFGKLASEIALEPHERQIVARYIAVQELRTPWVRDIAARDGGRLVQDSLRANPDSAEELRGILAEFGETLVDDEVNALTESEDPDNPLGKYGKVLWLNNLLCVAARTAPMIEAHPWKVVQASRDFEFITSDSPVVRVSTSGEPVRIGPGWESEEVETVFALTPQKALLLKMGIREGPAVGPRSWCTEVNRRTIWQAKRHVFARRSERWIPKVIVKAVSGRER